jgi:hypothetical protein
MNAHVFRTNVPINPTDPANTPSSRLVVAVKLSPPAPMSSSHKSLVEGLEPNIVNACRGDDCPDERSSRVRLTGRETLIGTGRDHSAVIRDARLLVRAFLFGLDDEGLISLSNQRYRFFPPINRRFHLCTLAVLGNLTNGRSVVSHTPSIPHASSKRSSSRLEIAVIFHSSAVL